PHPAISLPQPSPTLPARPRCLLLQVRLDRGQGNPDVATALERLESPIPDGPVHRKDMPHAQGCRGLRDIEPIPWAHLTFVDLPAPDPFNAAARSRPRGIVPVKRDPRPSGGWPTCPTSHHWPYVYTKITRTQASQDIYISATRLESLNSD